MQDFSSLFSVYKSTDPPPIQTKDYMQVKLDYDLLMHDDVFDTEPTMQFNSNFDRDYSFLDDSSSLELTLTETLSSYEQPSTPQKSTNIIQYFINKGLTINLARGIYGNIMLESGGRINALSRDGYNSYGIAQWTGKRKTRLFEMYGKNPSLKDQLDYLWWELNNTELRSLKALKESTTVEESTRAFMKTFERPHPAYANFNRRLKYALS